MTLEGSFPEIHLKPSLACAADLQLPVTLLWTAKAIRLSTGFESSQASVAPFRGTEAFSSSAFEQELPIYHEDNTNSYIKATTSSARSSYGHCELGVEVSIGGSFLGASGRGTYETKALANRDVRSIRGHASQRPAN